MNDDDVRVWLRWVSWSIPLGALLGWFLAGSANLAAAAIACLIMWPFSALAIRLSRYFRERP